MYQTILAGSDKDKLWGGFRIGNDKIGEKNENKIK